jgi:ABC-2 type transport system ATP-binding protein
VCLTTPGDRDRVERRALLWLDRYVKRDQRVDTGPRFETLDQNGMNHSAPDYPPAPGTPITASGSGTVRLTAGGGSGPAHPPADNPDLLSKFVGAITPAPATNAVSIDVATPQTAAVVVGAPQLRLSYTGTVPAGTRPERVFAQLVDPATGLVLGDQITPIAVILDDKQHTTTVPLEMVAYTTKPGAHLTLQIVATTVAYALPRLGGSIKIDASLTLPVAANLVPR